MATVAENLQTLINIKKGIKDAINDKGGTVTDSTPYAEYATEIENLPSGGEDIWKGLIDRSISGHIKIPNDITSIGGYAFRGCTNLSSIDFSNVTSLGYSCCQSCEFLTSVYIPNLTSIGDYAFNGCPRLTSVDLSNLTSIGSNGFGSCGFTSLDMPNVTSLGSYAFQMCSNLTSVDMPNVTSIGNNAFQYSSGLTSIDLYNVTSIGNTVFQYCSGLTSVVIDNPTPPTLGTNVFASTSSSLKIYVPDEAVDAYKAATNWKSYASIIYPISQKP